MKLTLSTPGLALRLFQSHCIMIIFGLIAFFTNDFTETNAVITAVATIFFLMISFMLYYNEANRCGRNDVNQGKDGGLFKGLWAGLLASIPGVLLWAAGVLFTPSQNLYRVYMSVYKGLLSFTGETVWLKLLILLPLPIVSAIAYNNGRKRWNVIEKMQAGWNQLIYQKKK